MTCTCAIAVKPTWLRILVSILAAIGFVGGVLELEVGKGFIFSASNFYRDQFSSLFLASALLCGTVLFAAQIKTQFMNWKAPTWFVRWLFAFPLLVLMCAGLMVASPLGWAALAGYVVGTPYSNIEVSVLSVDQIWQNSRKGCSQYATIAYQGNSASICLDGKISEQLVAGEKALANGQISVFGLFIDEISQ